MADWLDGWKNRKRIIINSDLVIGPSNFTKFPVVVHITNDEDINTYTRDDGYDIVFTDSDHNQIDHEIQKFEKSGGYAEVIAWVKIPTLSTSSDTTIYIYYNNEDQNTPTETTDTWDNDFIRVWHLDEEADGTSDEYNDSSGNDIHGTGGGGTESECPTRNAGKINYGQQFDGTDDWIEILDGTDLTEYTISFWLKPVTTTSINILYRTDEIESVFPLQFRLTGERYVEHYIRTNIDEVAYSDTKVTAGTWYYVAAIHKNGGQIKIFINGDQEDSEVVGNIITTGDRYYVGKAGNGYSCFDGMIDELRISDTRRSENWLTTEYNNQNDTSIDPANFIKSISAHKWHPDFTAPVDELENQVTELNEQQTGLAYLAFYNEDSELVVPDSAAYTIHDKFTGETMDSGTITPIASSVYLELTPTANSLYNSNNRKETRVLIVSYIYDTDKDGKIVIEYDIINIAKP